LPLVTSAGSGPPPRLPQAHAIANHCPGAHIAKVIIRTQPVPSKCDRHKLALGPIPPDQHHIARTRKTLTLRQTYFVDNVTTSVLAFVATK
jgi:hypothetical protein